VRLGRDFHGDMDRLIRGIEHLVPESQDTETQRREKPSEPRHRGQEQLRQTPKRFVLFWTGCLVAAIVGVFIIYAAWSAFKPANNNINKGGQLSSNGPSATNKINIEFTKYPDGEKWEKKLAREVALPGVDEAKLVEALDQLADKYDLTLLVDKQAFDKEMVDNVLHTLIADKTPISPMQARISEGLQRILNRIPVPSGARYQARDESIVITTTRGLSVSVETTVEKVPLAEVLDHIEDRFGIKIDRNQIKAKQGQMVKVAAVKDVHLEVVMERLLRQVDLDLNAIGWGPLD
jgi:hypothetical protein